MEAWAVNNGCELELTTTELPDLVMDDGPTTITRNEFMACDTYRASNGDDVVAEVSYFLIEDGGHAWPGGGPGGDGNQNQDINASEEIWDFFSRHSLPVEAVPGDFNADRVLTVEDVDLLLDEISEPAPRPWFDLTGDELVNLDDRAAWVELRGTFIGDSDLDGQVNAADLNALALNWRADEATSWAQGDFNGDGSVNAIDLNDLALNWRSGGIQTSPVPEPSCIWLIAMAGLAFFLQGRRSEFTHMMNEPRFRTHIPSHFP